MLDSAPSVLWQKGCSGIHMSPLIEKIDQLVFPERLRRYTTFRLATVFVAILAIGSSVFVILNGSPPEVTEQIRKLAHSPGFLTLHALVLVVGFWLIYWAREKKQYYRLRVLFYAMLLGGLVGEVLTFLLPLRP